MSLPETDRALPEDLIPNQYQDIWHNILALEKKGWLKYSAYTGAQNLLETAQHNPLVEGLLPVFGRISAETEKGRVAQIVDYVAQLWPDLAIRKLVVPFSSNHPSFERQLKRDILQALEPNSPALSSPNPDLLDQELRPILDSVPERNMTIGFATSIPGRQGTTPYWFGQNGGINSWDSLQNALHGYDEPNPAVRVRKPWLKVGLLESMPPKSEIIVNLHKPKDYGADPTQHFVVRVRRLPDSRLLAEFGPETADFRDLESGSPKFFISTATSALIPGFPQITSPLAHREMIERDNLKTIMAGDWLPITPRINTIAQILVEFCQRTDGYITSESGILNRHEPIHPDITNTELVGQVFDMKMEIDTATNGRIAENQSQQLTEGRSFQKTKEALLEIVETHLSQPLALWLKDNPKALDATTELVLQISRNRRDCGEIMDGIADTHPSILRGIPNRRLISEIYHMSISLSDLSLNDLESGDLEKTRGTVQNMLNLFFYFGQRIQAPQAMIASHRQMAEACLQNVAFQWKEFKRSFLGQLYQGEKGCFLKNLFDCLGPFGFDTLEFIGCPSYWPYKLFLYEVR